MIDVLHNFTESDKYPYYHICFYENEKIISKRFDLSKEAICEFIRKTNNCNFKVIGTLNNIDLCLRYINEKLNDGILGCDLTRDDVFESNYTIFVDCTKDFR